MGAGFHHFDRLGFRVIHLDLDCKEIIEVKDIPEWKFWSPCSVFAKNEDIKPWRIGNRLSWANEKLEYEIYSSSGPMLSEGIVVIVAWWSPPLTLSLL